VLATNRMAESSGSLAIRLQLLMAEAFKDRFAK
jgi:hypothetical protein